MDERTEYMFDTNAFDKLAQSIQNTEISAESLAQCGVTLWATHIQLDEINHTPTYNEEKARIRKGNRDVYRDLFEEVPTETFVLGSSRLGMAKLSDGVIYGGLFSDLNEREKKDNNIEDALIAEAAINNSFILVTNDTNLLEVVLKHGGESITFEKFLKRCQTA